MRRTFRRTSAFTPVFLIFLSTIVSLVLAEAIADKVLTKPPRPEIIIRALPSDRTDLAYTLPPNTSMVTIGIPFTTNEIGLRDDAIIPREDKLFRILCLGDSNTFGSGVATDETYPNCLEGILQDRVGDTLKVDVVNAGIFGYNARNIRAQAESLVELLLPDVMLYMFTENDLDDSFSVGPNGSLIEMDPMKPQDAPFINQTFPLLWKNRNPLPARYFEYFAIGRLVYQSLSRSPGSALPLDNSKGLETQRRWALLAGEIRTMKQLSESHGGKFVVYQIGMKNRSEVIHRKLRQICNESDIPFASTLSLFDIRTYKKLHSLVYDAHPNKEAHTLMAKRLDCFLQESGVLPKGCCQDENERSKYDEKTDEAIAHMIERIAEDMPSEIDLETGEGIIGVFGGFGRQGNMARSALFRLGGVGDQVCVEAKGLVTSPGQPQTLSACIQDSTPGVPVQVSETWNKILFTIPENLRDRVIDVELEAGGPAHIPTLEEREKGATPYTVAIRRIMRISGVPDP